MENSKNLYKILAFIGTILMRIGSFMSCLANTNSMANIGTIILIISIVMMSYSFYYWRP